MKLFNDKGTILAFILIILIISIVSFTAIYPSQEREISPIELAIVNKQPVVLYDGSVYRHDEENGWKVLNYDKKIKQIFTDESYECVLDVDGKLHCDELPDPSEPGMPLTSAYYLSMAHEALTINEDEKFLLVNGHVKADGFMALLSDGSILYQEIGEYKRFLMEEEVCMISGTLVLTKSGDVYKLIINESVSQQKEPQLELLYDGGDIVYIDGCVAITKEGKALYLSDRGVPGISDWNDLVKVVSGFNYVAGLTSKGKVVFQHFDEEKSAEIEGAFKKWHDIIGIEAYFNSIYGVDKNGEVFVVDF